MSKGWVGWALALASCWVGAEARAGLAVELGAGQYFTCAVLDDGRVKCWGWTSLATRS